MLGVEAVHAIGTSNLPEFDNCYHTFYFILNAISRWYCSYHNCCYRLLF